jgi:hypothetical protein
MSTTQTKLPSAVSAEAPNALQIVSHAGLPAGLMDDLEDFGGTGVSTDQEDASTPYLQIMQKGSPQVDKKDPGYLPGAQVGMILNTVTGKLYDADGPDAPGVRVMHLWFEKREVEWTPRTDGGGYVATHPCDTPLLAKVKEQSKTGDDGKVSKGMVRMLPGGTQLVRTNYHFVLIIDDMDAAMLSLSNTGLGFSRRWNGQMKSHKIATKNGPVIAPSFSRVYTLRTVYNTNDAGSWYTFGVEDNGWVDTSDPTMAACYRAAKEFVVNARERGVPIGRPPAPVDGSGNTDGRDIEMAEEDTGVL